MSIAKSISYIICQLLLIHFATFGVISSTNNAQAPSLRTPSTGNNGHFLAYVIPLSIIPLLLLGGFFLWRLLCSNLRSGSPEDHDEPHTLDGNSPTDISPGYQVFSLQEISNVTNEFDDRFLIGDGGFGKVYKATLKDGDLVAIKRAKTSSHQGITEFNNEIKLLPLLRHQNVVRLIGYCNEDNEMILVYEYMDNGCLKNHLYGSGSPMLSWIERLEICIGIAKGLHYLHSREDQCIIHRDIKTENILLDEKFIPKIADFGIAKTVPVRSSGPVFRDDQTQEESSVRGTGVYVDPQYKETHLPTVKSDVYSFGVVLLEVMCGRPAFNGHLPNEKADLVLWAMSWQKAGKLHEQVDKNLEGIRNTHSLKKFGEIAVKCLEKHGVDRPSMGDVISHLQHALKLHSHHLCIGI